MLINHECPLDLLETSLTFNDYEFVLPMFYEKYPKYKEFILKCKENGRFSILDNGLFEGEILPDEKLIEIIKECQPDIFVVPDAWNDKETTYVNSVKWFEIIESLGVKTKPMVVLQGKDFAELKHLYSICYLDGYKHFALNHSSESYRKTWPSKHPLVSQMMGRIATFLSLDQYANCYYHFLGCSSPQEFYIIDEALKQKINSVDTSNPVIAGIKGMRYSNLGLETKPKEKIEEFMEKDLSPHIEDIIFNISKFRQFTQ